MLASTFVDYSQDKQKFHEIENLIKAHLLIYFKRNINFIKRISYDEKGLASIPVDTFYGDDILEVLNIKIANCKEKNEKRRYLKK